MYMQIIAFCSLVEGRVCDDEDRVCCCVDFAEKRLTTGGRRSGAYTIPRYTIRTNVASRQMQTDAERAQPTTPQPARRGRTRQQQHPLAYERRGQG